MLDVHDTPRCQFSVRGPSLEVATHPRPSILVLHVMCSGLDSTGLVGWGGQNALLLKCCDCLVVVLQLVLGVGCRQGVLKVVRGRLQGWGKLLMLSDQHAASNQVRFRRPVGQVLSHMLPCSNMLSVGTSSSGSSINRGGGSSGSRGRD